MADREEKERGEKRKEEGRGVMVRFAFSRDHQKRAS